jgi:Recombinase
MLLAGCNLVAIAGYLNKRGHVTSMGNPWTPDSARDLLLNPLHGGLLAHNKEIAGPSAVPGIVSEGTWRAAESILNDPARLAGKYPRRPAAQIPALVPGGLRGVRADAARREHEAPQRRPDQDLHVLLPQAPRPADHPPR